jgi:hypothetical protein
VELLLSLAILGLVGPDRLLTSSDDYGLIFWQSLALAAAVQGAFNLIPHAIRTREGERVSDGLGILRSFFRPEGHYAAMIGQTFNPEERDWESYDPADWWKRGR